MPKTFRFQKFSAQTLPLLLTAYVVLQPFLDVLTSIAVNAGISITAGTVVRTLFMAAAFLYILFCGPFPGKRPILIYLGVLTGYLAVFFCYSLLKGGFSACLTNVGESLKVFYFPYTAAFLYALYRQKRFIISRKTVVTAAACYCLIILLAFLTGTSFITYNSGYGYSGWFFAANDVSTIVMLSAPVIVCYSLERLTGRVNWRVGLGIALVLFSLIFSANFIGTKVVFAGVLLYLILAVIWLAVQFCKTRRRSVLRCCLLCLLLGVLLCGIYPFSPLNQYVNDIYVPMSDKESPAYQQSIAIPGVVEKDRAKYNAKLEEAAEGTWLGELIHQNPLVDKLNWILSKRLLIAAPVAQEFTDGGPGVKLLGLGYAPMPGYTRDISHLIEMEGTSLLLRHGIAGFLVYYVPYLGLIAYAVVQFFRRLKTRMGDFLYCSYFYSTLMAFAASLVAGHVLVSPAVSLFVAILYLHLTDITLRQNRALAEGLPLPAEAQPF